MKHWTHLVIACLVAAAGASIVGQIASGIVAQYEERTSHHFYTGDNQ
jgi:hypothetical protein